MAVKRTLASGILSLLYFAWAYGTRSVTKCEYVFSIDYSVFAVENSIYAIANNRNYFL